MVDTPTIVPIRVTLATVGLARMAQGMTAGPPAPIAFIALGTGGSLINGLPAGYVPTGAEGGLRAEVVRMPVTAAAQIGVKEWMVEASFPAPAAGTPAQWITEAAAFLSDGTLAGIWSRISGPLFARIDTSSPLIGFTISFDELPDGAVQFVTVGMPSLHLSMLSFSIRTAVAIIGLQSRELKRIAADRSAALQATINRN